MTITDVDMENQRRQLEALGLLGEFAPSCDIADALGSALLEARAKAGTSEIVLQTLKAIWVLLPAVVNSGVDSNAVQRLRELTAAAIAKAEGRG